MKPCSQVLAFGANFHGYRLPLYSLFGNVNGKLYVCTNLFPRKDKWYTIKIWDGYNWKIDSTQNHTDIRKYMKAYMSLDTFQRKKCIRCQCVMRERNKAEREEAKFLLHTLPFNKKHPEPQYRCFSQSRVDGRGYDISWESNTDPLYNYYGLPVEYRNNMPAMEGKTMNNLGHFDGVGSSRKDGLKVPQTKCRPGKTVVVQTA